jgi:cholest-4-en-3-one 26-monooxygenase
MIRTENMPVPGVDLCDPDTFVRGVPFAAFDEMRRTDPVRWQNEPDGPGFWSVTRHADVHAVNLDHVTFSSARRGVQSAELPEDSLAQQQLMLVNMDPPVHTRYRHLVSKGFTAQRVSQMEDDIRQMATGILDRVCEKGTCDFVSDIAAELPLQVIAELLGVPSEDRHMVLGWSNRLMAADDPEHNVNPDAVQDAAAELFGYFDSLVAHRRAEPRDDLVTALLHAQVDGECLSDLQLDLFFLLLSVAGNETTRNTIAHGMVALVEHPAEREVLRSNPSLISTSVDEMLRWGSSIMHFRRTATRDTVIGDQKVSEGQKVLIWYISANRDGSVFDDPYRFDVRRSPNPHVSFGAGGPHYCLGANLARLQIRVLFEELLARLTDIELAGPVVRLRSNFLNGLKHVPVRFTPKPPSTRLIIGV